MGKLDVEHPELLKEWNYKRNGDLRPEDLTSGSGKKVWWICEEGHEWQASIDNRSKGRGCPYCAGKRVLSGFNDLATLNPEIAAQWHPTRNGDLKPEQVMPGSSKKVWWKCDKGHEWQATIASRSKGSGCPFCAGQRAQKGIDDLATLRPDLAKQWHPTKNGGLTPKDVKVASNKKVWWICEEGHEWQTTVSNRSNGGNCPYCSGHRAWPGYNDLATLNPELAKQWHPTKNGNLKPDQITVSSNKKVWWKCDKGHEWQAVVASRNAGKNCPYCSGHRAWPGFNDLATLNPELAKQWHPTKNGDLTPQDVTIGSHENIWWQCEKGHEWQATVNSRSKGIGCPFCNGEKQTSFPEQALLYYIGLVTPVESRPRIDEKYEVDIFLPELNVAIEYDGWYWHKGKEKLARDEKKYKHIKALGIHLIRVKEIEDDEQLPNDTRDVIYCHYDQNSEHLNDVIKKLMKRLGIVDEIDVDPTRDASAIYSQYVKLEKENSLANKLPEIAKEWHPTKNGDLMPEQVRASSNKKIWWRCDKGHEWQASPNDRKRGYGCPYCSNHRVWLGHNDLATLRPELAAQWHPTKNGELSPKDVTAGSHKKVWWQCDKGHEWQSTVDKRSQGGGCPICSGKKVLAGYNDLATIRPDLAAQWHPTKNGDLTPKDVTSKSNKKIWWRCENGHEWQATVSDRSSGRGCPICSGRQVLAGFNDLATTHPDLAEQWHPTKNGDLTPHDVSAGSGKKIWWICEKGHEWQAAIYSRSSGVGCPSCWKESRREKFN